MVDPGIERAAERVVLELARNSDRADTDAIVAMFTADAEVVLPGRTFAGHEKLRRFYGSAPRPPEGSELTKHVISNVLVDHGASAGPTVTSYFQMLNAEAGLQAWGRYVDDLVPGEDAAWLIRRHQVIVDGRIA
jgi:ketosteroid isomerase-like protein